MSRIRSRLEDLIGNCRRDALVAHEPRARGLLEASVEVLAVLRAAYDRYERGDEMPLRT